MSFGVNRALAGLYEGPDKREGAVQNLAILENWKKQLEQDKVDQETAQLKEQAYYEQISKFADTLLGPDRDKINQKAKLLSQTVSENLKLFGGDLNKFFQAGGHKFINQYKNDIVNSSEASSFLENKKNMEMILDLESKGMGHLLNSVDRKNLENYFKNKGGQITYTGLLNEIVMPDDRSYAWGEDIPAIDILMNDSNRMKILANYKLSHPDLPFPPDEKSLLSFVESNYNKKGSNYQIAMFNEQMRLKNAEFAMKMRTQGQGGGADNEDGYLGYKKGDTVFNPEHVSTITGGYIGLFQNAPKTTVKEFTENDQYWENNRNYKGFTNGKFSKTYMGVDHIEDHFFNWSSERGFTIGGNKTEKGIFGRGDAKSITSGLFHDRYSPLNSQIIMDKVSTQAAGVALGIDLDDENIYNKQNNTLLNYRLDPHNTYTVGGKNLVNTRIDLDAYTRDYRVEGIITVGVAKSANRNEDGSSAGERTNIVMGVTNKKGILNPGKTNEYNSGYLSADVEQKIAVVLEDDKGNVFYHVTDPDDIFFNSFRKSIESIDDRKLINQETENRRREAELADAEMQVMIDRANVFYDIIQGNSSLSGAMPQEFVTYSKNNYNDGVRNSLIQSFYVAAATGDEFSENPVETFGQLTSISSFTKSINNDYNTLFDEESGNSFEKMIRNYSFSNEDLILNLYDLINKRYKGSEAQKQDELSFVQRWLSSLRALDNR